MNTLEKKSFYSFLLLYIISSTLFITLSAYWYYTAQKNLLESNQFYKLEHTADTISRHVIHAHMSGLNFSLTKTPEHISVSLIDLNGTVKYGEKFDDITPKTPDYFTKNNFNILISDAPQKHLNIKYVVVRSNILYTQIKTLKEKVLSIMFLSIFIMIILAFVLSRLFMKPVNQKIKQIEDFVHDTAHELNTPITALSMSVSRALKKKTYDEKILKNISISTKQLFDIYNMLSYLSFETQVHEAPVVDVCRVLEKSVAYYKELAQSKHIDIELSCETFSFAIEETKLSMLFGNLINNAIKYSHPKSSIEISFHEGIFKIKDYGIGIHEDKLSKIYERFNRETEYAGGFGIGLSIVQKIAKENALYLEVKSTLNEGSCFSVHF